MDRKKFLKDFIKQARAENILTILYYVEERSQDITKYEIKDKSPMLLEEYAKKFCKENKIKFSGEVVDWIDSHTHHLFFLDVPYRVNDFVCEGIGIIRFLQNKMKGDR